MTFKQVQRQAEDLNFICKCTRSQRVGFFKNSTKRKLRQIFAALAYISKVLLYNRKFVKQLSANQRQRLRQFVPTFKKLAHKNSSLKQKVTAASSQSGHGLFSALIPLLAGVVVPEIVKAVKK